MFAPTFLQSARARLLLLIVVVFTLTLGVIGAGSLSLVHRTEQTLWRSRQEAAAQTAARTLGTFLGEAQEAMTLVGLLDAETLAAQPAIGANILRVRPALLEVIRVDARGALLATAANGDPVLSNLFTISQAGWFQQALAGAHVIGPVQFSAAGTPYTILAQAALLMLALTACSIGTTAAPGPSPAPTIAATPAEMVFYGWEAMFPPAGLTGFQEETGMSVRMVAYSSSEEAIEVIAGGADYDLMIMGNEFVPQMIAGGLLAEIDFTQVPNFKNISANFRGLAYDLDNRYSVPYTWGTTGLVIDASAASGITKWSDLWQPEYAGKIAVWGIPRHVIAMTLKSLGYSANSEDPAELEAAYERLRALKPNLQAIVNDNFTLAELLQKGEITVGMGYAGDVLLSREKGVDVGYVLPDEGTLLWGDNYVIPARAAHKAAAEQFLDYLLRPEVSAAIVEHNFYATPNDAARPLVDPAIRDDVVIFPPNEAMRNAEIILALSEEGQARYDELWKRLMDE